jgi:CRP-like cAMP-binding protein
MRAGSRPSTRRLAKGALLTEQGAPAEELYLLLDGILSVSVDGGELGELGPGAIIGDTPYSKTDAAPPPCAPQPSASSPLPRKTRSTQPASPASPASPSITAERTQTENAKANG